MTNRGRHERADALLDAALALPADRRDAFLERECGGDRELRTLVERLLAHAETPTALDGLGVGAGLAGHEPGPPMPDPVGSMVNGRYEIEREIGRGGMGRVYAAQDRKLGRRVAMKILAAPDLGLDARERFQREARATAALNHPNIVTVYDAGETDGRPFLVMELVEGPSLEARPPDSIERAVEVAEGLCLALQHAHDRGLVHRDLKPSNVLLSPDAQGAAAVKLADLGIALGRETSRVTRAGAIVGTPAFMAPECALGQRPDGRADLYSLGVMLYLWTTGRLPFEGEDMLAIVSQHIHAPVVPPSTFCCDLPRGMETLILSLLAKTPAGRPANADDVRTALRAEIAGPVGVRPVRLDCLRRGCLVGRRVELERLQALRRASGDDRVPMALISGEPGVGKTRLARELIADAQLEGVATVSGGCYENEATTPYLPFIEAFRAWVSEQDDERLARILGDSAAEIARLAPEIESRLGSFPVLPSLSPGEERLRLFDHVARFLRRLAGPNGRLLLFIDDLQWADGSTMGLLQYLLRDLAGDDVFFLATYREAELSRTHPLSKALAEWNRARLCERIRLDRLSFEDTNRLLTVLLAQEALPDRLVQALYSETEGSPFFVEEVVKALIAEGDLVRDQDAWRRRSSGEFVIPQSVKMAIGSRLETVSETSQQVLRIAAVLGKSFEFEELATVAGVGEAELLDALDEADCAQLIVAGKGESFSFTHDKIREVLYDELNPIRRRRLHARIAQGLERLHHSGEEVPVEQLAYHYVESGDHAKGLIWARRAAEAASRVFAWDEALAALHRARDCAAVLDDADEVARIDLSSGAAAMAQGDLIHAADHFERGLATVEDRELRNELRVRAGEVYVTSGDPRGRELVEEALAELDGERSPWESGLAAVVEARYRHLSGDFNGAVDVYCRGIPLVEAGHDNQLLVRALSFLAGTYQHMARFAESDDVSRRCIAIGNTESVPDGVMLGNEFLSENAYYRGYWEACIRHGEEEEALASEYHAGERYLWSHFRAHALHAVGRIEEADSLFARGIAESEQAGERRLGLFLKMGRALCLADQGHDAEALESIDALVAEADEAGLLAHRITGRGIRAAIARNGTDREVQLATGRFGAELWVSHDSVGVGLVHGADLAEALVGGGAPEQECADVLDRHLALAEAGEAPHRAGQNHRVRARLHEREGRADDAFRQLGEAIPLFEIHGGRIEQVRTLAARGRLMRQLGDEEGASADLDQAGDLVRRHALPVSLLTNG